MYYRYSRQKIAIGSEEGKLHKFLNITKTKAVLKRLFSTFLVNLSE